MYRLYKSSYTNEVVGATKIDGGIRTSFLFDPANTDYAEYLKWLAAGNQPIPANAGEGNEPLPPEEN